MKAWLSFPIVQQSYEWPQLHRDLNKIRAHILCMIINKYWIFFSVLRNHPNIVSKTNTDITTPYVIITQCWRHSTPFTSNRHINVTTTKVYTRIGWNSKLRQLHFWYRSLQRPDVITKRKHTSVVYSSRVLSPFLLKY